MKAFATMSAALIVIGCASSAAAQTAAESKSPSVADSSWSYVGAAGPGSWGRLSDEYSLCSAGQQQSPINITGASPMKMQPLQFEYRQASAVVMNNGHTVQATFTGAEPDHHDDAGAEHEHGGHAEGSLLQIGSDSYKLVQFHYHHPSEHLIDGVQSPLEVHLVHQNAAGALAIVAVLFKEGPTANPALASLLNVNPKEVGKRATTSINVGWLLPRDHAYTTYNGSLTTPPCSEGVTWIVLGAHQSVTRAQLNMLNGLVAPNARPVQKTAGTLQSSPSR